MTRSSSTSSRSRNRSVESDVDGASSDANTVVDRKLTSGPFTSVSSCQLSTYFVGRTAFHRLRQAVQRELGDKFELGRYHEAVLANGTPPVKYLPELVRERLKQPR